MALYPRRASQNISAGTTNTNKNFGLQLHGGSPEVNDINSKFISGLALPDVEHGLELDDDS